MCTTLLVLFALPPQSPAGLPPQCPVTLTVACPGCECGCAEGGKCECTSAIPQQTYAEWLEHAGERKKLPPAAPQQKKAAPAACAPASAPSGIPPGYMLVPIPTATAPAVMTGYGDGSCGTSGAMMYSGTSYGGNGNGASAASPRRGLFGGGGLFRGGLFRGRAAGGGGGCGG